MKSLGETKNAASNTQLSTCCWVQEVVVVVVVVIVVVVAVVVVVQFNSIQSHYGYAPRQGA